GCHAAIREGWARLVTGAEDVVAMLSDARQLVQGALDAHTEKRAGTTQDCKHRRSGAAAMDTTTCVNLSSSMSSRTSSSTASNASSNTPSKSPSRAQLLRQPSIDGCSPQPRHGSQVVDPNQTELSQDAQELFEWIAQHVSARESRRGGATLGETRANAAFRAGLDELEHHLGWSIPRLAAATLSLERIGRIVRDSEGAFLLAEKYR
ncbi:MAG: hypothetical protein RL591_446, partial [Planctomycetota bacterium]